MLLLDLLLDASIQMGGSLFESYGVGEMQSQVCGEMNMGDAH